MSSGCNTATHRLYQQPDKEKKGSRTQTHAISDLSHIYDMEKAIYDTDVYPYNTGAGLVAWRQAANMACTVFKHSLLQPQDCEHRAAASE